jgi:hypothetical protein
MLGSQRNPKFFVVLIFAPLLIMSASAQEAHWRELKDKFQLLYQQGKYSEGLAVAQEDLHVAEATFGPSDVKVALSLNNLALIFVALGKYVDAEPLQKRSLAIQQKLRGPNHAEVATNLDNLAQIYRA